MSNYTVADELYNKYVEYVLTGESKDASKTIDCEIQNFCTARVEFGFDSDDIQRIFLKISSIKFAARVYFYREVWNNRNWHRKKIGKRIEKKIFDDAIAQCWILINNLQFDKFSGGMDDKPIVVANYYSEFQSKATNSCIKPTGEENCCVCLEPTLTQTICRHTCCYVCQEKLEAVNVEGTEDENKYRFPFDVIKCPSCRDDINQH